MPDRTQLLQLNRRVLLAGLFSGSSAGFLQLNRPALAAGNSGASLVAAPSIVVRTTENITKGNWVWLLNTAHAAGVRRIYLLVKQDENNYASKLTGRTLRSGEMLVPIPGALTAEGWEDTAWLDEMLIRARSMNIEVHAWWPCFQDAIGAAKLPEAAYAGDEHDIFLDPARPEVQAYASNLLGAFVDRYAFDGVALDWVRYNVRADGSTGPLAASFRDHTGLDWSKQAMELPLLRAVWDDLRARTVANWVRETLTTLRPRHPHLTWGAFVLPWQFKEVSQSYRHLSAAGLDSLQPMIYWRDWKEDVGFTSEVIAPTPFVLSGRTSIDPTFDITENNQELAIALDFLPVDRLGSVTWYHHGKWSEADFQKLAAISMAFAKSRTELYANLSPDTSLVPPYQRLEPAVFPPDASLWALVCLGALHRREALVGAEPVVPVLCLHRFTEGKMESGASVWHTSTEYLDALFAFLKEYDFTVTNVDTVAAYMTSEDPKLLPARPLVITIDDGSASVLAHFEPRAAVAKVPYAVAIVTSWMNEGTGQIIDLGNGLSDINLTWEELHTLHRTGRVNVISHSHEQHRYVAGGNNGTESGPAMTTRLWMETNNRREKDAERLRRVYTDLKTSRELLASRFGGTSTFLAWPYGMHDDAAEAAAMDAGFTHFFEFAGAALAAPKEKPQRIMRLAVMQMDEVIPLTFPEDPITQQRWWLAFLKRARETKSVDLIEAALGQLDAAQAQHPEADISRAAQLILNGHAALAVQKLTQLRTSYPHDSGVHGSIDEFEALYSTFD
jgi:Polysaccharide deacetylase/Glycosyl hydrolase-like 10